MVKWYSINMWIEIYCCLLFAHMCVGYANKKTPCSYTVLYTYVYSSYFEYVYKYIGK